MSSGIEKEKKRKEEFNNMMDTDITSFTASYME
jgi:hypothetical protein